MSYSAALNSVRDYIIDSFADYTTDNCAIGDEGVFAFIQADDSLTRTAIVISPEPFEVRQGSEFMSATISWQVGVNVFFGIIDNDIETPIQDAITMIDDMFVAFLTDPTLDGTVHSAKITSGGPLMTYARGNYFYFLMPFTVSVLDNILV